MLRTILAIIILFTIGYASFGNSHSDKVNYRVIVYGRDDCGSTQYVLKEFKKQGIRHKYVKAKYTNHEVFERARQQGISTIGVPVIEVDNHLSIGENLNQTIAKIRKFQPA